MNGKQNYECLDCGRKFVLKDMSWVELAYQDYTIHKQTLAELEVKYNKSDDTIRKYFDDFNLKQNPNIKIKQVIEKPINLVFDTTFFKHSFGIMIFRADGHNLARRFVDTEKLSYYLETLQQMAELGYIFQSFVIDGRHGLIQLLHKHFNTIPIQICQFHQVAIVTRYTTKNPKTECGQELRQLILRLKDLDRNRFAELFQELQTKYKDFLKERNEQNQFQHRRLRAAFRSIKTNLPYLFTYLSQPELSIPNTSNSADGSFGQWKYKVKLHRHLRLDRKQKLIDQLLGF